MGQVVAKVRVSNPHDKSKYLDLELLVDTGSTYTWINGGRLKSLGIEIMGERKFRTIENRIVEMKIGEAVVECLSRKATAIVVFAQEGDNEEFGLHALEGLGLEVDPITKKLKEVEAVLALNCI
jgi:predicted aspartyl protease